MNLSPQPSGSTGSEQVRYVERSASLALGFEQMKAGMTLAEVRSLMGEPGAEVSGSALVSEYRWGDLAEPHIIGRFESECLGV